MNPKRAPKLFIGPWIGEFGVELLRWQSIARTLAQSRAWSEIIVATHPDRFCLYDDFATKFVSHIPKSIHTVGFSCVGHQGEEIHQRHINVTAGDVWLNPKITENSVPTYHPVAGCLATFRNFALKTPPPRKRYDILIHARATPKANQHYKNWLASNYNAVVEALPTSLKIASVGAVDGSHKIRRTDDLRGIPLKDLAAHCGVARLMIGPSSGTIHFAVHCGLPVVTWLQEDERYNYFPQWNPLNTPLCCMRGWQPDAQVVHHKTLEMLHLVEGAKSPVEMIVAGSKRSGHHALIEWIARLMPHKNIQLWNDCSSEDHSSFPDECCELPTKNAFPKMLHAHNKLDSVFEFNTTGRSRVRFLSFEGIRLSSLAHLPECQSAKRIVIVIRDVANTAASLKRGIPCLEKKGFLHPDFHRLRTGIKEYLIEALGHTKQLSALGSKVVFVSYNRWHADPAYRRQVAASLGLGTRDAPRGSMSTFAHKSAFQHPSSKAENLNTLDRWSHFAGNRHFWNFVCDSTTHKMEKQFHGDAMPDYAKFPA